MVNLDGLTLFGPGSEWFWSMLQFAVVAVTPGGTLSPAPHSKRGQRLGRMQTLQDIWQSEKMAYSRLAIEMWRRGGNGRAPDPEAQVLLGWVSNFFEDLSDLHAEGYLPWKEIENSWGQALVIYWAIAVPAIAELRADDPAVYLGFERLARRAEESAHRRGADISVSEEELAEILKGQVARSAARLRLLRNIAEGGLPKPKDGQDRDREEVPVSDQ